MLQEPSGLLDLAKLPSEAIGTNLGNPVTPGLKPFPQAAGPTISGPGAGGSHASAAR
jgi:hypothetical protein